MKNKRAVETLRWLGCCFAIFLALFIIYSRFGYIAENDPDRYFNLRVAAIAADQGLKIKLSQFPDLGWDHQFPDKEFLYHQFLGLVYRIGGERAVQVVPFFLALGLILLLFGWLTRRTKPEVGALAIGFVLLTNPLFMNRLFLLRSWVFTLLLLILLIFSADRRRPLWVCIFASLYALSYNALFIPAYAFAALLLFDWRDPAARRCVWAGFAGLTLGTLINPNFPEHLNWIWLSLEIATRPLRHSHMVHGAEVQPLSPILVLRYFFIPIALAVLASRLAMHDRKLRYRAALALMFTLLLFFTNRATEYAVPFAFLVFPECWEAAISWIKIKHRSVSISLLVLSLSGLSWMNLHSVHANKGEILDIMRATLLEVPLHEKLLNGDWAIGAEIFYLRPDLQLLDTLDPAILFVSQPELSFLRDELAKGTSLDWPKLLSDRFKSRWIVTRYGATAIAAQKEGWGSVRSLRYYLNPHGRREALALIECVRCVR